MPHDTVHVDFSALTFHPIIRLPHDYVVLDLSTGPAPFAVGSPASPYEIGRYDEQRRNMYVQEMYRETANEPRDVHIGLDIGAPVGEVVYAFHSGRVFLSAYKDQPGDYGGTVITEHVIQNHQLWVLHGHLSRKSIDHSFSGRSFAAGDTLGWVGPESENGGWKPHVHIQLSWVKPDICDMPGVVRLSEREVAKKIYPDPRLILGPLY